MPIKACNNIENDDGNQNKSNLLSATNSKNCDVESPGIH
jgi:hypothetical protein